MALQQIGLDATLNNLPDFTSGIGKMNAAVDGFAKNSAESGGAFSKGFGEIVTGALREIGTLAVDALAKGGQAVAGFLKDSIGVAGDFQQEFAQFQIAVGHTIDGTGLKLDDFKKQFISLGKELPVSTQEVEQAAVEMARGGIDPAVIAAGGLRQTIQFASAALKGDLVQAAQISAKTMQAWTSITDNAATKTDFLTHAQNLMTQATTAASTTVDQLFLGLSNVGGTARLAGVSFDETVKALAQLTPAFASSADAGTALKTFFARLQPTTDPAGQAMERLGLYTQETGSAFYDAQGKFIGMQAAEDLLQKATSNLTDAQREQALQTIFGNDAIRAAGVFALQGQAGYDALSESITKQTTLTDAAKINQDTYNTAVENAKGSVEALQITIGSALLPVLTDLMNNTIAPAVNTLTTFASAIFGDQDAFKSLSPILQEIVTRITAVVAAFNNNGIVAAIDMVIPGFTNLLTAITPVTSFLKDNFEPVLFGIGAAIATVVVPSMVAAVAAFVSAAAPVAALVAAGALLYQGWTNDWGGIQEKTAAAWAFLQPLFTQAVDWLGVAIPKAAQTLADFWDNTLLPAFKTVGTFIEGTIFPILSDFAKVWLAAAAAEITALEAIWSNVLWPALKAVGSFIDTVLRPIFVALFDVEFAIASKVVEALAGLWQKVLWPALQDVGSYINGTVIPTFQSIGNYLNTTFGPALRSIAAWLEKVTGGFSGVSNAVSGVVTWIENLATSISNLKLPSWLTPGSPTPWEIALRGIGDALQTGVLPNLAPFQQGIKEIGQQITDTFSNTDIVNELRNLGENAIAGFGKGLKSGLSGVMSVINSTADTVEGAFKDAFKSHSPSERMVPVGEGIVQGIEEGILQGWPSLTDQVGSLADGLTGKMQDISKDIQSAIAESFGGTASLDRQIAANLDKVSNMTDSFRQQFITYQLRDAQQIAESFADPAAGAKYYKMASNNLFELESLREKLNAAATDSDRARIQQQIDLINNAQAAELKAFGAQQQAATSPAQDIADKINDVLKTIAGIHLTDDQIKIVDLLSGVWAQLVTPPNQTTPANTGLSTTLNQQTNLNMPIYTNQSPDVLQHSMAIAGAALP